MSEQLLSEAIKAIEARADEFKQEEESNHYTDGFRAGLLEAADMALAVGQQRINEPAET